MNALYDAYLERMEKLYQGIAEAIHGLPQEALDWVPGPEMNSLAVLIVHTAGSARFWIGDVAMEEPSGRDREAEFRTRELDEAALIARLDASMAYARDALSRLPESELGSEHYNAAWGKPVTVALALLHTLEHIGTHLGHIHMTRQLWEQAAHSGRHSKTYS